MIDAVLERGRDGGDAALRLTDFLGGWRLERTVSAEGGTALFEGIAEIAAVPGGAVPSARYTEAGTLRLADGRSFRAEQVYLWTGQTGRIAVSFADGRPFHEIDLTGQTAAAEHLCGADRYRAQYDFSLWPDWSCRWQVSGPAKDYVMLSCYSRR